MRAEKHQLVKDIADLIGLGPSVFLTGYKGLTAAEFEQLRESLDALGSQCHVVPNRLLKRAIADCGLTALEGQELKGDTALVCGGEDPVAVAKALNDFAKKHEEAAVKVAVVEGTAIGPADVKQLADLPPKEVLQAQLLGLLQAPAGQLVRVLNAKVASVVYVITAYLNKKEEAA